MLYHTGNRLIGLAQKSTLSKIRALATATPTTKPKAEGDISSVFPSLSGGKLSPLPERFVQIKKQLILGYGDQVKASWDRLLHKLQHEIEIVKQRGSAIIPSINFKDIHAAPESFREELKKRGAGVVRNVVSKEEALKFKTDAQEYIKANPSTKAFPPNDPQVFELYWSPSQIRARSHPNMTAVQRFLMQSWHSTDSDALVSSDHPVTYADRLRIRQPGDSGFALGPHVDGGSVERWEAEGYGKGRVYEKVFQGRWEEYDPWASSCRVDIESDLYNGAGACSMFRMFQGWMSLSATGPGEGTLLVNPLLQLATAYYLLRPFFAPAKAVSYADGEILNDLFRPSNWQLIDFQTSELQGANPGSCQELNHILHPHLRLPDSMVHIPKINPGDYVVWHCDTIHAVDKTHLGTSDSSVLYIPVCPLTERNAQCLLRQRDAFLAGTPGPDFPGGKGESEHVGRPTEQFVRENSDLDGLRAFGLEKWEVDGVGGRMGEGQVEVLRRANEVLGFGS